MDYIRLIVYFESNVYEDKEKEERGTLTYKKCRQIQDS